jgi:hypothetical protein
LFQKLRLSVIGNTSQKRGFLREPTDFSYYEIMRR